jgi:hypothetical protein
MNINNDGRMKTIELTIKGEPETQFQIITQQQLEQIIMSFLPYYSSNDSWFFDNYYVALPVDKFKYVLEWWWKVLEKVNYIPEVFDCNHYVQLFSSLLSACGYNSSGMIVGELYHNNEFLGYHAWNLILFVNPQNQFKIYEFEPQTANILLDHRSFDGFEYNGRWVIW